MLVKQKRLLLLRFSSLNGIMVKDYIIIYKTYYLVKTKSIIFKKYLAKIKLLNCFYRRTFFGIYIFYFSNFQYLHFLKLRLPDESYIAKF